MNLIGTPLGHIMDNNAGLSTLHTCELSNQGNIPSANHLGNFSPFVAISAMPLHQQGILLQGPKH